MERVGEDVDIGLAPRHQPAVEPDPAVAVVDRCAGRSSRRDRTDRPVGQSEPAAGRASPPPFRGSRRARRLERARDQVGSARSASSTASPASVVPPGLATLRGQRLGVGVLGARPARPRLRPSRRRAAAPAPSERPSRSRRRGQRVDEAEQEGRAGAGQSGRRAGRRAPRRTIRHGRAPPSARSTSARAAPSRAVAGEADHALAEPHRQVGHRPDDRARRREAGAQRGQLDPGEDRDQDRLADRGSAPAPARPRRAGRASSPSRTIAGTSSSGKSVVTRTPSPAGRAARPDHADMGGIDALPRASASSIAPRHIAAADEPERPGEEGIGHRSRHCEKRSDEAIQLASVSSAHVCPGLLRFRCAMTAAAYASPWVSISAAAIASCGVLSAQSTNWKTG